MAAATVCTAGGCIFGIPTAAAIGVYAGTVLLWWLFRPRPALQQGQMALGSPRINVETIVSIQG
jgi:hypothetical protein